MQALQRVHRSRSIGLSLAQVASKAPSQPLSCVRRPLCTARSWPCDSAPPLPSTSRLTSSSPPSIAAARSAASAGADDQAAPAAAVGDRGHRVGRRQLRRGNQRRELGGGGLGVLRPAAGFAHIDEADRPLFELGGAFGLLVEFEKQPRLLRAGHEQVVARLRGALERARLAPAQQGVRRVDAFSAGARRLRQRRLDRRAVQRHRAVAVAQQGLGHRQSVAWVQAATVPRQRGPRHRGSPRRPAPSCRRLRRRTDRGTCDCTIWRSIEAGIGSGLP